MPRIDSKLIKRLRRFSLACAALVVLISCTTITGHFAHLPRLTSIVPGWATMKFNTAFVLLLTGVSLMLRQRSFSNAARRWANTTAGLALFIAFSTLLEYVFQSDFYVDQLFWNDPNVPLHGHVGRMSIATAFALSMVTFAALLLDLRPRIAQVFGLLSIPPALLGLLGYLYGVGSLYEIKAYSSMALHTVAGVLLLAGATLTSRPRRCLHDLLVRRSPGGMLVRRVLPATVIIPLALALLCLEGNRRGWFGLPFGLAVISLGTILSITGILWWNATMLDRTDAVRQQAESERNAMLIREHEGRLRVEQALATRDQLLAVVSHELRQPLTPVLLTTAALLKGNDLPDDLREDIEMIHSQIAAEARIVNDLLEITALNQGKIKLFPQPMQVEPLLSEVANRYKQDARRQRLELRVEPMEQPVNLQADRRRVEQVLSNLLSNAIKFTPAGGKIGVRCCYRAGTAVIDVIDSGIGIDPAALPDLFNYFSQADATTRRRFGGMGVGLSIARRLAELHGGTLIGASAGVGKGAQFTLTLPCTETPVAASAS